MFSDCYNVSYILTHGKYEDHESNRGSFIRPIPNLHLIHTISL